MSYEALLMINITKFVSHGLIKVKVIPNSKKETIKEEHGILKIHLTSVPEKNKANAELVKFFKKKFGLNVEIISGQKSREKVLHLR